MKHMHTYIYDMFQMHAAVKKKKKKKEKQHLCHWKKHSSDDNSGFKHDSWRFGKMFCSLIKWQKKTLIFKNWLKDKISEY